MSHPRRYRPAVETLEDRTVLSPVVFAPVKVNTSTSDNVSVPANASSRSGASVVAWQQDREGGQAIRAQRFDVRGRKLGGEIVVAQGASRDTPAVAMDDRGDFVVAWHQNGTANISARRYTAAGTPVGAVLTVASRPVGEFAPHVAMDAAGDFVVTYQTRWVRGDGPTRQDFGDLYGVSYLADGRVYRPFIIAIGTANNYVNDSAVARAPDGRFSVAYSLLKLAVNPPSNDHHGSVIVRNFSAQATPAVTETLFTDRLGVYHVAVDDRANAVVVYSGTRFVDHGEAAPAELQSFGVYGHRVNATGGHTGGIVIAPTGTGYLGAVALDRTGGTFVVAWSTESDPRTAPVRLSLTAVPLSNRPGAPLGIGIGSGRDPALSTRTAGHFLVTYSVSLEVIARLGTF